MRDKLLHKATIRLTAFICCPTADFDRRRELENGPNIWLAVYQRLPTGGSALAIFLILLVNEPTLTVGIGSIYARPRPSLDDSQERYV